MLRKCVAGLLSILFLFSTECQADETLADRRLALLVESNDRFAFDLYYQLAQKKGNLFFSPYSISAAFAMTAAGAREETAKEMMSVLHLKENAFPGFAALSKKLISKQGNGNNGTLSPTLNVANAIWPHKGLELLPFYRETIEKDFGAPIYTVDYENTAKAIERINNWVEERTNGKIRNLLSSQDVSLDTRLVLTSAIYMKAQWMNQFSERATKKGAFHMDAKTAVDTDMMTAIERYDLYTDKDVAVLALPYSYESEGPKLVMMIVLPATIEGLSKLEEELTFKQWLGWMEKMDSRRVRMKIPKFKMESRFELNSPMEALGMKLAFSSKANFSDMTGKPDLFISKAVHQTFINVDEKGTEAAAATGIVMNKTSLEVEEPYNFNADHPFLFIIYDQATRSILFMGRFAVP